MVNYIQIITSHQAKLRDKYGTWHPYIWKAANKIVFIKIFPDRPIELKTY